MACRVIVCVHGAFASVELAAGLLLLSVPTMPPVTCVVVLLLQGFSDANKLGAGERKLFCCWTEGGLEIRGRRRAGQGPAARSASQQMFALSSATSLNPGPPSACNNPVLPCTETQPSQTHT